MTNKILSAAAEAKEKGGGEAKGEKGQKGSLFAGGFSTPSSSSSALQSISGRGSCAGGESETAAVSALTSTANATQGYRRAEVFQKISRTSAGDIKS